MANRKNIMNSELRATASVFGAITKKEIKYAKPNNDEFVQLQLRWGNNYTFLQIYDPIHLKKIKNYNVNDVIHVTAELTNSFNFYSKSNYMTLIKPTKLVKVGQLAEEYQKKV